MRLIDEPELEHVALGAAVLGTGGGGDPYVGKLLAQQAIREHGPVQLVGVDELADDDLVVPSAMMGAPTVMVEKIPHGEESVRAFRALQDYLGKPITHTTSIEAGGLNSTIPFVVAAAMGIPLVDADLMGRAFPEIQMCTPTLYAIGATPMAVADEKGNVAVLETIDNLWAERFSRSVTVDMGCSSMIALYAMRGSQVEQAMIPGTLQLAQTLGEAIDTARREHGDPIEVVLSILGGLRLFEGKVVDVKRRTQAGFARGDCELEGIGPDRGATLRIQFQNEHLIAVRDGEVLATTPDLIMVLDSEAGLPITTEEIRYGFRVTVLAAPCDSRWRSPEGLEVVGPRYFGYEVDYRPVEEIAASR
jgi:hypothetical protein